MAETVGKVIAVVNPDMWQQSGGLIGLIILALFIILILSVAIFGYVLMEIYKMQRVDIREMIISQNTERAVFSKMADDRQKETNTALDAMTKTLEGLTIAIRELMVLSRSLDNNIK